MSSLVSIQVDLSHKIGEVLNESLNPYGKIFLHRIVIFAERIIQLSFHCYPTISGQVITGVGNITGVGHMTRE
jgi:hypothetical protein